MSNEGKSSTSRHFDWPEYEIGPPEYVHALGVLTLNFNDLEDILFGLLKTFNDAPDDVTALLFQKTANNLRIEWLSKLVEAKVDNAEVSTHIASFTTAFSTCADNRGLLVHSRVLAYRTRELAVLASKRSTKSAEHRDYEFPLEIVRRVADETFAWGRFGRHLLAYVSASNLEKTDPKRVYLLPSTLPETPPAPMNVGANFPGKSRKPPTPPQSSEA